MGNKTLLNLNGVHFKPKVQLNLETQNLRTNPEQNKKKENQSKLKIFNKTATDSTAFNDTDK